MGEVTCGIIKGRLSTEYILFGVKNVLDSNAVIKCKNEAASFIQFTDSSKAVRLLSVQEYDDEFHDEYDFLEPEEPYTYLSLGYTDDSPEIMKSIMSYFAGWVDDNDCDDKDFYFIQRSGEYPLVSGETKSRKPKDIEEVERFIFDKLKEEFGENVLSKEPGKQIVVDTETSFRGNSDVWIDLTYFY